MKIDLSQINTDQFMIHDHLIGGQSVKLVQPVHIGCEWSRENEIFRSSVWDTDGNLVSASFKKFVNWGEKPAIYPPPSTLSGSKLMEKMDGSTLIFSRWNGNTIIRTRGTVDARGMANGHEIDFLCQKYAKFVAWFESCDTVDSSFLFEWTSPENQIVINYGYEADMVLIGIVDHADYSYVTQASLDAFAKSYDLRRPRTYSFDSVGDMKAAVSAFKGVEGVCVYFHDDQDILKVKAEQYLYLHRAKSEISSVEKVMDVYLSLMFERDGVAPTYNEFFSYLEKIFDYEIACMARGNISNICDAMKEVEKIIAGMKALVEPLFPVGRRYAAIRIIQAYGSTGRASMAFNLLDRKILGAEAYKKLLFQVMKG